LEIGTSKCDSFLEDMLLGKSPRNYTKTKECIPNFNVKCAGKGLGNE
jgi:hypothetical protein